MSKSNTAKLIALITAIAIVLILILVGVFALGKKSPADQQPEQTEAHTPEIQTPVETEETEPSVIQPNAEQAKDGSVTIPGWLLLSACIGIVALCALFLIIGMIIGSKQGQRYID